jgi:hypothetical protein
MCACYVAGDIASTICRAGLRRVAIVVHRDRSEITARIVVVQRHPPDIVLMLQAVQKTQNGTPLGLRVHLMPRAPFWARHFSGYSPKRAAPHMCWTKRGAPLTVPNDSSVGFDGRRREYGGGQVEKKRRCTHIACEDWTCRRRTMLGRLETARAASNNHETSN